jgi:hypothetical protein
MVGILWLFEILSFAAVPNLAFTPTADGGFQFDTGVLTGRLGVGGKSGGLMSVIHTATRLRLDDGHGLLNPYRVFSRSKRYGTAVWDWPCTTERHADGAVKMDWDDGADRPFRLHATYRWRDPLTVELEMVVTARVDLPAFEVFVASWFDDAFTNASICVAGPGQPKPHFASVPRSEGEWQIFPRSEAFLPVIQDGRWRIPPDPVDWAIRAPFALPVARRKAASSGLSGILMAPPEEVFAIAAPHDDERHHSLYLSLFGDDVAATETRRARIRLAVAVARSDSAVLRTYQETVGEWAVP